jgi:hypothetical protein
MALTKTDMVHLKKEILNASIIKHQGVIDDFRQRINEMMATDGNVNEEEYDSHTQSHKAEAVAEVSLLSDQLQFANHELEELRKIESYIDHIHSAVEFGTVVVTDNGTFFVSASIEQFFVDGKSIFGLSVRSPLYKCMKGKGIGDTFSYN